MGIIIPTLVAAFFALYLAWISWHRWPVRGARPFAVLMLVAVVWAFGYTLELMSTALQDKIFWGKFQYVGISVIPAAWLVFCLRYTATDEYLPRLRLLIPLLSIPPALTLVLALAYPFSGLLWSDVQLVESAGLTFAHPVPGHWYWIYVAYSYTILAAGAIIVLLGMRTSSRSHRQQSLALVVAVAAPWTGNFIYMFGLGPYRYLDPTPIGFVTAGLVIAVALFRFELLNLAPIVRDRVVEALTSAYVVVDPTGRVLDLNRAASELLRIAAGDAVNRPVSEIVPGIPYLDEDPGQPLDVCEEMAWSADALKRMTDLPLEGLASAYDAGRYVEVRISPIFGRGGWFIGHLLMLSDITERVLAEWVTLANKAQLERLISERTAEIQAVNIRLREQIRARSDAERDLAARAAELESLYTVGRSVTTSLSVKEVASQAAAAIHDVCDVDLTVIYKREADLLDFLAAQSRGDIAKDRHETEKGIGVCLCGKAAQMGQSLYSEDIRKDARCELAACKLAGIRSFAALPILVGSDMLGVLGLGSREARDFFSQAQFLEALVVEVGLALRNALLYQESQRRLTELSDEINKRKQIEQKLHNQNVQLATLNNVATATSQELDIARALRATLDELVRLPGLDAIWLHGRPTLEGDEGLMRLSASISGSHIPDLEQNYGAEMDLVVEERLPQTLPLPPDENPNALPMSLVLVPVQARESVLGVLAALCSPQLLDLEGHVSLLFSAGHHIGLALENVQLQQLTSQIEVWEKLDRLRSDLVASVSHEIRTPLGLIKLFATTLQMRDPRLDPNQQWEFLDGIVEETEALEKIVEDLLSLGSYDSDKLRLDRRRFDLRRVVSDLIGSMRLELSDHRVVRDYVPYALVVNADPHRIGQVVRNLLSNAVKYSTPNSEITICAYESESEAIVYVKDEGVGIPEPAQLHIFERFYRVDNEATNRTRGAGLGLSISRAIVEAHGGRIWFESRPGQGSTFYVALPLVVHAEKNELPGEANHDGAQREDVNRVIDHEKDLGLEERADA